MACTRAPPLPKHDWGSAIYIAEPVVKEKVLEQPGPKELPYGRPEHSAQTTTPNTTSNAQRADGIQSRSSPTSVGHAEIHGANESNTKCTIPRTKTHNQHSCIASATRYTSRKLPHPVRHTIIEQLYLQSVPTTICGKSNHQADAACTHVCNKRHGGPHPD